MRWELWTKGIHYANQAVRLAYRARVPLCLAKIASCAHQFGLRITKLSSRNAPATKFAQQGTPSQRKLYAAFLSPPN